MENTQYPQEDSPSTIYFVEEMKPEYLEYIDSCKERAQSDSAYWQELKESMSRGMIQLADNDDMYEHDTQSDADTQADTQYDESADGVSEESIRSLLEYQIKMLENMNYAIDMLTEKCDELTKYCSKLAKRLKKYNCSGVSNPIDVSGIINNTTMSSVNKVNNAPVIVPIQNKSLQQSNVNARVPVQVPVQVPTQAHESARTNTHANAHANAHVNTHVNTHANAHANALTFTRVSDQSVTDETDNSDDDFTETNSVNTDVENIENTDVKQVDL